MKLSIFNADASQNAPALPATTSEGYPTDGSPTQGIPATEIGAYWLYQLIKEHENLFAAAGLSSDPENLTQILQALRQPGVFQTPAQFNNTTKAATTAFVQRALGNLSALGSTNESATMTATHIGGLYAYYGSTAGQTVTLPDTANILPHSAVWIINQSTVDVTLAGNGDDIISANNAGSGQSLAATLLVKPGDSLIFIWNGSNQWNSFGYTSERLNPASKNSTGYGRDPSGLIEQWGVTSTISAGGVATITLPIPFPNEALNPEATPRNGNSTTSGLTAAAEIVSTSQIKLVNTSTVPFAIWWRVKGH